MLFDVAALAFVVHPNRWVSVFAGRFGITGEVFDLHALAIAPLREVTVEHPLGLVRRRRAAIRPERHADDDPALVEGFERFPQANRTVEFPRMDGRLRESRHEIRPHLHAERDNQIIIIEFLIPQYYLLAVRIYAQHFGLDELDVAFFQQVHAAADLSRLALAEHAEQERRHEQMIGPLIDKNDIVLRAQLAAEVGRSDHTAAAAAQDNN